MNCISEGTRAHKCMEPSFGPLHIPVKSLVRVGISGVHGGPHLSFENLQRDEIVSFSRDLYLLKPTSSTFPRNAVIYPVDDPVGVPW